MSHAFHNFILAASVIAVSPNVFAQDSGFSPEQICRGTIAAMMGRSPTIIKATRREAGVVYTTYVRANDGTRWNNRCKFEGAKVIWATDTGRWRTNELEEVITYSEAASALSIHLRSVSGEVTTKVYGRKDLAE